MRLFDISRKREITSLNGAWKSKTESGAEKSIYIPSVINNETDMLLYEGSITFTKSFYSKGGTLRFVFEGVQNLCAVYFDGKPAASHYGGFTAFDFIVSGVAEGEHTLRVDTVNEYDKNSIPQRKVDWFHYSGITRDVYVERLKGLCILDSRLVYELDVDQQTAVCHVEATLFNADDKHALTDEITVSVADRQLCSRRVSLGKGEKSSFKTSDFTLDNIKLWDIGSPKLYSFTVSSGSDELTDKTGFRKIEIRNGEFILNGSPLVLKGINRHEEYPSFGFAFPKAMMLRDIAIIKDLGCNAVRGSHYPNDKYFLDLLDENGILFWSEIPVWGVGFSEETLSNPTIIKRGLKMHEEMCAQYYNHPSAVIYGLHNEILSDTDSGYNFTESFYRLVKEKAGNRLITYASNHPLNDICFKFCDFISVNLYHGWYGGGLDDWDKFVDDFALRLKEKDAAGKPVVMSEFGAAAIYGNHTFDNIKWTEEYQANLLNYTLTLFEKTDYIKGTFIWQFTDIRTYENLDLNRARGYNNKGILNEHRKPKLAYYTVKNHYAK